MQWQLVEMECDTAELLRMDDQPLTSPRWDDMIPEAQRQARLAYKSVKNLAKAGAIGEGQIRINIQGVVTPDDSKMPAGDPDFVAISIARRP